MERTSVLRRTGVASYRLELTYDQSVVKEITQIVGDGEVVPETFTLVWTRSAGQLWQRDAMASCAFGYRKNGDSWKARRLVYAAEIPVLRGWATLMPGLRPAIEEIEASLPQ